MDASGCIVLRCCVVHCNGPVAVCTVGTCRGEEVHTSYARSTTTLEWVKTNYVEKILVNCSYCAFALPVAVSAWLYLIADGLKSEPAGHSLYFGHTPETCRILELMVGIRKKRFETTGWKMRVTYRPVGVVRWDFSIVDTKRGSVWQCCIHACLDDVKKLRSLITVQFNECATSIFWGTSFSYVLSCCQEQWSPMHTARKERKTRERPRIARLLLYEIIDFLFVIVVII